MINLFVTGMLRSGTTLLEKSLNAHPDIRIFYQPFSELFIHAKRQFLRDNAIPLDYHALSHYCQETRYTPADFSLWLKNNRLPYSFVQNALADTLHPFFNSFDSSKYQFDHWYSILIRHLNSKKGWHCLGSKEVLMEEFIPHFLNNNIYSVIILRDPRDLITSLDYGKGKVFTGNHRPTLFNLRNWRKSVNFALNADGLRNFCLVKYEELVKEPVQTLNKISQMIGLISFKEKWWEDGLYNENGSCWKGNSSFCDISPFNPLTIGRHVYTLSDTTRLYIEAVCRREMVYLGYEPASASLSECKERIINFRDEFSISRSEFASDYSTLKENIDCELKHLEYPDVSSFLFEKSAKKLLPIRLW